MTSKIPKILRDKPNENCANFHKNCKTLLKVIKEDLNK